MGFIPIILLTIAGLGILAAVRLPGERQIPPLTVLGLAFWVGVLAATFVIMLPAVVTGRMFYFLFYVLLAASLVLLTIFRSHAATLLSAEPLIIRQRHAWLPWLACLPFIIIIAVNIVEGISVGTSYGLAAFDPLGNFAVKARLWHETRLLKPPPLLDPEFLMYKRSYPPVVPLMEGLWAFIIGEWNDQHMKWFFLWCWISTGALIYGLIRSRASSLGAVIGLCFWFSLPVNIAYMFGGAISGYADVPLALAFVAAVFMTHEIRTEKAWPRLLLLAFITAGPFWLKKEGLPFAALLMLWLTWKRTPWKSLAVIAAVWILMFLIYKMTTWKVPSPFEDDMGFNHSSEELLSRIRQIGGLLWAELQLDNRWGERFGLLIGLVWIYKFASQPWRNWFSKELYLFFSMAIVYTGVLLLTHYPFDMNLDWVFERLFIHILPLLIVATFINFDLPSARRQESSSSTHNTAEPAKK